MNTMLKQLTQWPPTTSTVIGAGVIAGMVDYLLTGSFAQAVFIAGILKIVCPEDAGAAGELQSILPSLADLIAKSKAVVAALCVAALVSLTACGGTSGNGTTALQSLLTSPTGASLVGNLVSSAFPQLNAAIAKGSAASAADMQLAAYWLPWLDKAVDVFGPTLGMAPADIAKADATTATLVASLQNPPADVGSLMGDVSTLVNGIAADLKPAISTVAASAS